MSPVQFLTVEDAAHEVVERSWPSTRGVYFGAAGVLSDSPQAWRSVYGPGGFSSQHFHHTDQFQVFFGTPTTIFERKPVGSLLVHYADPDTLYGPFGNPDDGLTFFTLRRYGGNFRGTMPLDKDEMSHDGTKRHYKHDLAHWLDEPYPHAGASEWGTFIGPHEDGLTAHTVTAGPGAVIKGPHPSASGGRYYLVVGGEMTMNDSIFPEHSLGWISPDDEPPELVAGDPGCRLLILQFGTGTPIGAGTRVSAYPRTFPAVRP